MAGTEISVAVAERIPVLFLVLDDGRLGMVERGNEAIYGRTPFYPTGPMNIPQMASALGAKSMVIQRPGELLELGHHLRDLKEPLVVDVLVDRRFKLQAKGRNETLGKIASRREAKN
jgi:acetolactate synthase-1/2/3 large subunit